jgi:hypothetical protein
MDPRRPTAKKSGKDERGAARRRFPAFDRRCGPPNPRRCAGRQIGLDTGGAAVLNFSILFYRIPYPDSIPHIQALRFPFCEHNAFAGG